MNSVFTYLTSLGFVHLMGDMGEVWIHWDRKIVVDVMPGQGTEDSYVTTETLNLDEDAKLDELLMAEGG